MSDKEPSCPFCGAGKTYELFGEQNNMWSISQNYSCCCLTDKIMEFRFVRFIIQYDCLWSYMEDADYRYWEE
jgi:hypothetical protein